MSIILTDTDVYTLARACPHLNSINLGNHNTPVSLGALGYMCDAVVSYERSRYAWMHDSMRSAQHLWTTTNKRLMKLDIGELPIACAGPLDLPTAPDLMMSIPRFLHTIAPRLAKLEISLGLFFEWTRQTKMETRNDIERWEKVEDALSELAQEDDD
ncbi:hypothetical protein EV702DRAFT_1053350 [Suillus placidus]|uniref:Uncharacterized protein n=1 Tax=Suillus placidus TaxID=48579 RepID=A0A9P7CVI3_9AGAM|nr:hypothetical protein EV702DRAFT_1053350 [Suillus placidus]